VVLGEMAGIPADSIVITDVYNCRFFKQFLPADNVESIQDRDVICGYQIVLPESKESDISYYPIIHRKEENGKSSYQISYPKKTLLGSPFVLSVPDSTKITYKQLYDLIYTQIQRYLKNIPKGKIIRTTEDLLGEGERKSIESEESDEELPQTQDNGEKAEEIDSSDTETEEEREKPQPAQMKKKRKLQPLFTIKTVDSYGNDTKMELEDEDKPIDLADRQTLAVCWTEEAADHYYDENLTKDIDLHESCNRPPEQDLESSISLDKCIDMFTTLEKLGPEDPWYCVKCKEMKQATKKFDLWSMPPILVIHLKRFSYKNRYWREKLETFVNYPTKDLDISQWVKGPTSAQCVYDLYAVSNHYGSLGGGHYTAYGKNYKNGKWYKFDDSSVSEVEESRVVTSSAYVLFYRRKDTFNVTNAPIVTTTTTTSESEDGEEAMDVQDTTHANETSNGVVGDAMEEVGLE